MDFITKFNRSFLKAIQSNKVQVIDYNAGAVREASIKFNFTHEGDGHFYSLSVRRNCSGLEDLGYPERLAVELSRWNPSYIHGIDCAVPEGADISAIEHLKNKSIIPPEITLLVVRCYEESANNYAENMM
jgi:hypothetical protein